MASSPNIIAEFSMFPVDKGISLSPYVARILDVVDSSGIDYELHSMGTILEGPIDQVFAVIQKCHSVLEEDCDRIAIMIKTDYRKGRTKQIQSKIEAVENVLGHQLHSKKE